MDFIDMCCCSKKFECKKKCCFVRYGNDILIDVQSADFQVITRWDDINVLLTTILQLEKGFSANSGHGSCGVFTSNHFSIFFFVFRHFSPSRCLSFYGTILPFCNNNNDNSFFISSTYWLCCIIIIYMLDWYYYRMFGNLRHDNIW